jgi:hypothetical protein
VLSAAFVHILGEQTEIGIAKRRVTLSSDVDNMKTEWLFRARHYECRDRRIGLSPLSSRYLIVGTSFYYGSAGRDGVAAIWAPKSTGGHRRITRNSRALVQPGEVFLGSCSKTLLKRET